MNKNARVADRVLAVEAEMRRLGLWSDHPPSPASLQSSQPFCVDTLEFHEWLQFIFLPRMKVIIEEDRELPVTSGIAPMAEEAFRDRPEIFRGLNRELQAIDQLLSSGQS
ncbi:YqcC family protein [Marinobacter sp.]|uniref:YqcC family protein n=1 Tax=Marinobacter sp. TaxID=50741 RepID=UPI003850B059